MSGLIPQHFINDLVSRVDIVDVLSKRIDLKKAGKEFKAVCPFHNDKNPSLTISPSKGFYHCFSCGAHGTALGFLMEYEHLSFVEAIESLASDLGLEVPYEKSSKPIKQNNDLFSMMEKLQKKFQDNLKDELKAIKYLKERGIDGRTAKKFGIGYAKKGWRNILDEFGKNEKKINLLTSLGLIIKKSDDNYYDRFRDRIIFPIRDARGRFIGFGGRVFNDEQPKYLNSPETSLFHKGKELYGLYECQQSMRDIDRLVVVEGYMDVIGLSQNGVEYAVASMGTATTNDHFNRLFRLTDSIFFCFDGDDAGLKAAWRALENSLIHLRDGRQIKFVFLPDGEDPDSYIKNNGTSKFEEQLDSGKDLSDFLIDKISENIDLKSIDGKARLAERAKPLISKIPDGIFKELIIEKLSISVNISSKKLTALISKVNRKESMRPKTRSFTKMMSHKSSKAQPSIIKKSIMLILNYPEAAKSIKTHDFKDYKKPGIKILLKLIKTTQEEANINAASLIERWRDDDEGRHLAKLAINLFPDNPEFDASKELNDSLVQITKNFYSERINFLIEKQSKNELSEKDKNELSRMIIRNKSL
ncbi:MAG: DNA primase [Gammaproteobacteria bacterium]|nr:MAG: DNA primase [Gammaproteobacteria bacterium]